MKSHRDKVKARTKIGALLLIAKLAGMAHPTPEQPVVVNIVDKDLDLSIRIRVASAAAAVEAGAKYPGLHLGTSERLVWGALAAGPLTARQIATALEQPLDARLQLLLQLLLERGVLAGTGDGYARAELPAAEKPDPDADETTVAKPGGRGTITKDGYGRVISESTIGKPGQEK